MLRAGACERSQSYTALVVLGNIYSDWAFDVAQAAPGTGAELPMRAAAISYYERARG